MAKRPAKPLYTIMEKESYGEQHFMALKRCGQNGKEPDIFIALLLDCLNKEGNMPHVGDKIEYTPQKNPKTGSVETQKFFAALSPIVLAQSVRFWKPNIVYSEGYKKLRQPQTRFKRRHIL
jgi:hypothetical protein